jgi:hypothetical protein
MKTLHWSMHAVNGPPYFARLVSYKRKMFIKLATGWHSRDLQLRSGTNAIKLFLHPSQIPRKNKLECSTKKRITTWSKITG